MLHAMVRSGLHHLAVLALGAASLVPVLLGAPALTANPAVYPLISDMQLVSSGVTPPTQAQCNAVGRRCFNPTAMHNSYNYAALLAAGNEGQGKTIALIDSFGSATISSDLAVFNTEFGLPHLCGETGPFAPASCAAGMPTFTGC